MEEAAEMEPVGELLLVLGVAYLYARVRGPIPKDHPLHQPISQTPFFRVVAARQAARTASNPNDVQSYVDQFCRYLCIPDEHSMGLVGRLTYQILRVLTDFLEQPATRPPKVTGIKWPARLQPASLKAPPAYTAIADRLAGGLAVDRGVFDEIWQAYGILSTRRLWEKRVSASLVVFWVARFLKAQRSDVYWIYRSHIEHFRRKGLHHIRRVRDCSSADDSLLKASVFPFSTWLRSDPLLNCVFHSEVFDARRRLFPRSDRRRDDNKIRSQMIAYSVRVLRTCLPDALPKKVQDVLTGDLNLPYHVENAIKPSAREGKKILGYSLFAYASGLVAAMIDDKHWILTPDNVKEIFNRYCDEEEVKNLFLDLGRGRPDSKRGRIVRVVLT